MDKRLLITALCSLLLSALFAQMTCAQSSKLLSYRLTCPDTVRAGDTVRLITAFDVAPDWYVYAPGETNEARGMQPLHVKFRKLPAGVKAVGDLAYSIPAPKGPYIVYMGNDHTLMQQFVITADAATGPIVLRGELIYQACNDETCYPPMTETFFRTIRVE